MKEDAAAFAVVDGDYLLSPPQFFIPADTTRYDGVLRHVKRCVDLVLSLLAAIWAAFHSARRLVAPVEIEAHLGQHAAARLEVEALRIDQHAVVVEQHRRPRCQRRLTERDATAVGPGVSPVDGIARGVDQLGTDCLVHGVVRDDTVRFGDARRDVGGHRHRALVVTIDL